MFLTVIQAEATKIVEGPARPLLFMLTLLTQLENSNPKITFHRPRLVSNR